MKKKSFLLTFILLMLAVIGVTAGNVSTLTLNGAETSSPEGFFTHDASGKFNFNDKFTGAEYDGISFTSGLKMEGSTKILFTTAEVSTVTIVQSTWSEVGVKFDDSELNVADAALGTGCRIYTVKNVAAGDHSIGRGSGESGLFYVKVEESSGQEGSLPILTLKGNVGEEVSIKPGVYDEFDVFSVDFGDGVLVTDSVGHQNKGVCVNDGTETWPQKEGTTHTGITEFKGTVAGDGTIKVYGKSDIWYLALTGAAPETIDQPKLKKVVQFTISKVALDALDLKGLDDLKIFGFSQGSLKAINVKENAALTDLTINNNSASLFESVLEALDLSGNANLEKLNVMGASAEKPGKLQVLDLSANTKLTNLYAQYNALTSVILPEGAALSFANLQNNQIESIDLTKVASFKDTYLNNNKLKTVDLSKLTAGANLYLDGNELTEVTVPVSVKNLQLNGNKLTKVSIVEATASCKLENNQLTLATIPAQPAAMNSSGKTKKFTYAPQAALEVAESLSELDLSAYQTIAKGELDPTADEAAGIAAYSRWLENGTTTYSFVTASGTALVEGTDYEVTEPGKFKFLKEQTEKVHGVMLNPVFPKFTEAVPFVTTEFTVVEGGSAPGAPEIANASFDANPEDVITVTTQGYQRNIPEGSDQITGLQPVTGWTAGTQTESDPGYVGGVFAYGSENLLNNKVAAPATAPEGSESPSALGLAAVWGGYAHYTQSITAPAGDYKLSYTVYNGANTGAVTKNLFGFIADDGTEYLSDVKSFTVGEWATYDVTFTLAEETTGKISVGFIGSGGSGNAPHLFVDNVKLEKVAGIEVALKELEAAIAEAQAKAGTYTVGEGLFMYAASEIEPLTAAIATAQAAYTAAESKEAVATATESLNAFVAAFAPVATLPDADKTYSFQSKQNDLYMTLSDDGITIAEEPYGLKFEAAEDGKYYLTDGVHYVGLAGTDNWSMSSAADLKEALTIAAKVVDEAVYYTLAESKGFVGVDYPKKDNLGCWANKGAGDGDAILWTVAETTAIIPGELEKVAKKIELTGELKSIAELEGNKFMLQNEAGLVLYTPDGWDVKVADLATATANKGNGGFFTVTPLDGDHAGQYQVPIYNLDGTRRTYWAGEQYLNSQPAGVNDVIFGLDGTAPNYGQDGKDLALWTITYEEGKGFAFHCVGRDIYLSNDESAARPSETAVYWKAYSGYNAGYNAAEVLGAFAAATAAVKTTDDATALANAKTAYDEDKDLDKFGDAVNAAIDAIKACEALNEAYSQLDETGAAVAAEVLAKYNASEYANIAALRAAYIPAAKAQTTAGSNMTLALVNPSFELGNIEGWTSTDGGNVANNYNFSYRTGEKFVERWTQAPGKLSDGTLAQVVTGLPAGKYKLTAEMQNLEQGNDNANGQGYYLVANSDSTAVAVAGETVVVETTLAEGEELKIEAAMKGCTGNWVCVDNFQLTYLGEAAPEVNPDEAEKAVPEGWENLIANGNMAGDDVSNFFSKEAPEPNPYASTITPGAGKDNSRGIIIKSAEGGSQDWDSQFFIRANKPIPAGTKLHMEFDYKASAAAKVATQGHGEPGAYVNNDGVGDVNFTTEWQHLEKEFTTSGDIQTIAFNMNILRDEAEYYIDNIVFWAEKAPEIEWVDIVKNGDMEGDDVSYFATKIYPESSVSAAVLTAGAGKDGSKGLKIDSPAKVDQDWDTQFWVVLPIALEQGTKFKLEFDYKADADVTSSAQYHAAPGDYIGSWVNVGFTTDWQHFEKQGIAPAANNSGNKFQSIAFNLTFGTATTLFFDNVKLFLDKETAATGIKSVNTEMPFIEGAFYDLQGRRVAKPGRGLYIVNGTKVMVK